MIPGIQEIVIGLLRGDYTGAEAERWINQHIELGALGAENGDLRDHFAAKALAALLTRVDAVVGDYVSNASPRQAAEAAYRYADAMLAARSAK